MDSKFTSKMHFNNLLINKAPEIFVNVDINIVDFKVTMIFEHKSTLDDSGVFKIIVPYICKNYGTTDEELSNTFKEIDLCKFSFSFDYKKLKDCNSLIENFARDVLLRYSVSEEQIIEIKFSPENYKKGKGVIHAKIDAGYDEDTDGYYPIAKHKSFLEEKLQKEILVYAIVDLS